jgi:uncharacterized membrane protein
MITAGLYEWLRFGHVVAAMIWLGGGVMLVAVAGAALRGADQQALARFVASLRLLGPSVLAPATITTLGLGVWLVLDSAAWDFAQTWVQIALALIAAAIVLGAGHQAHVTLNAQRAIERDDHAEARRQLVRWIWGYALVVVLLVAITWDMTFKPGL